MKKNSPQKPAKETAPPALTEKDVTALFQKMLAENRKERIAKKRTAYEGKLWRNYKAIAKNLVAFYERQQERLQKVEYVDGSNVAEKLFEKDSLLLAISEINEKLSK